MIMAVIHGSAISFLSPCNKFISFKTTNSLLSVSASNFHPSFPSNLTKRKNHLRIKILKTLTKPSPFSSPPEIPIVSPEILRPDDVDVQTGLTTVANGDEIEESRISESTDTSTQFSFGIGEFSWGSVFRFGVYFIAVFAFQTICTVWVLDYGNSVKGDRNSDKVLSVNRKDVLLNGNEKILYGNFGSKTSHLVYLEELKMREKMEEIRLMAREARKEEKNRISEGTGDGGSDGNVISRVRVGVGKEVDARLVKLQKRLNSSREKIPELHVNYLLQSEKVEDVVERNDQNGEEGNSTLTFKKKLKYRSSPNEIMKKPKGFQGSVSDKRKSGSTGKVTLGEDESCLVDNVEEKNSKKRFGKEIMNSVSEMLKDDGMNLTSSGSALQSQSDRKQLDVGTKRANTKPSNGVILETSSAEKSTSQKSIDSKMKNSQSFPKGNQETSTISAMPHVMSSNDSFVEKKSMAHEGKQSNKEADLWWLDLPYVLVILMHRGSDDEGQGGLFTLKIPSKTQDLEDSACTVAFEDRVDANNFCYLLESFFEGLDDFTADVVPLAAKELEDIKRSYTSNIIVVKKGQLQLYVGQPFTDVEMALFDLFERNEILISQNPR